LRKRRGTYLTQEKTVIRPSRQRGFQKEGEESHPVKWKSKPIFFKKGRKEKTKKESHQVEKPPPPPKGGGGGGRKKGRPALHATE